MGQELKDILVKEALKASVLAATIIDEPFPPLIALPSPSIPGKEQNRSS